MCQLTKTTTSYHDAAQAYSDYAPRLREAQDTFDRAVDRARAAAPQADQAPRQLGEDPTDEEKAEARRTQDAIDAGKTELNAAKGLAEQAKAMRQSAQRACTDVLDRAAKEADPERNVFPTSCWTSPTCGTRPTSAARNSPGPGRGPWRRPTTRAGGPGSTTCSARAAR
ncbi:hypothetical protein ACWC2M_03525 [Streptomyces sp. NPDC001761]